MLTPISKSNWTYTQAAHLLNRAGFGGTPQEIHELVQLGPAAAVAHLIDYEKIADDVPPPAWAKPDPERFERMKRVRAEIEEQRKLLGNAQTEEEKYQINKKMADMRRRAQAEERSIEQQRMIELRGIWLDRMTKGPRPLQEKLTLFWHGHFATSFEKVRNAWFMWMQNETFRRNASGSWAKMLHEVTEDPAMLIWLDQAQSDKRHPNENYAREVMELFALGEGHYTENDILEAARALTGLTLDRRDGRASFDARRHDDGTKTLLGKTGNFGVQDVLDSILAQPQAARFIAFKLWRFFASESTAPDSPLITRLAAIFRNSKYELKPLLRAMFLSEEFYAPDVMHTQIKSPVQWLVGTARMLNAPLPPAKVAGPMLGFLGQNLFEPPNVKGWDGGPAWITTNTLFSRYNQATLLVLGSTAGKGLMLSGSKKNKPLKAAAMDRAIASLPPTPVKPEEVLPPSQRKDKDAIIAALERRLLLQPLNAKNRQALREYLDSQADIDDEDILQTVRMIMCTPEYQLT